MYFETQEFVKCSEALQLITWIMNTMNAIGFSDEFRKIIVNVISETSTIVKKKKQLQF